LEFGLAGANDVSWRGAGQLLDGLGEILNPFVVGSERLGIRTFVAEHLANPA
jgi:hypothetical protein